MAIHEYEQPWQVMPAKIIKLALEHAEKNDDFDHKVAYLLLDIGVETALKVFLENKGQDIENLNFHKVVNKVVDELSKNNSSLIKEIEETKKFHSIRNKLYHQGEGVIPAEDYLKRYSELAKKIVEGILELKLQTEERKFTVSMGREEVECEELIARIEGRWKHFEEYCGIVTEKARPAYATREFAMQMQYISDNWPDREESEPEDRIETRRLRLEKFNELVEKKQTSYAFVNYVLEDVNHLYVYVALRQTNEKWQELWKEYIELDERRSKLLYDWKFNIDSGRWNSEQIPEEFQKIVTWIATQERKVVEWINSHLEHVDATWDPPLYKATFFDY